MENAITLMELTPKTLGGEPMRKKRRPALACQECRRRKIRCDRQTPCGQCSKANVSSCSYVCDNRTTPNTAPFEAHDTHFSVLQQSTGFEANNDLPVGSLGLGTAPRTPSIPSVHSPDAGSGHQSTSWSGDAPPSLQSDFLGWNESVHVGTPDLNMGLAFNPGLDMERQSTSPLRAVNKPPVQGMFFKSRFLGQSHWKNFAQPSSAVQSILNMPGIGGRQDNSALSKCKTAARKIKAQRCAFLPVIGSNRGLLPERSIADRLVQAYLRTIQSVLGIVSVPSFYRRYVALFNSASPFDKDFEVLLLLVLAIGWVVCSQEQAIPRSTVLQWVDAAKTWLNSPGYKKRLVLDGVRIHCLFILACQLLSISDDQSWLETGSLIRTAMHMGLHIDPTRCAFEEKFSRLEIQSRRRLWATVLELELQTCMDRGLLPGIDVDDYDTEPPLNVDDATLESTSPGNINGGISQVSGQDMSQMTSCSLQILLVHALPVRLKIARFLNSFQPAKQTFEKALGLSADLCSILKLASDRIEAYRMSCSPPPTSFQTQFFDQLVQRTILALHHPFAVRALKDQSLYYSRKMCFEATLSLLSRSVFPGDVDFYQLRVVSGGLFQTTYTQCALFLCAELVDQSDIGVPSPANPRTGYVRREMQAAVQRFLDLVLRRIRTGTETNVQLYATLHGLLAQAEAIEAGLSEPRTELRIQEAINQNLETVLSILSRQCNQTTHPVDLQTSWMNIPDVLAVDQEPNNPIPRYESNISFSWEGMDFSRRG